MKMLKIAFVSSALALVFSSPSLAFENFIPAGTGYSTEVFSVPEINTEKSKVNARADIYETEIYNFQRDSIVQDSRMKQFFSDAESTGADTFIDY